MSRVNVIEVRILLLAGLALLGGCPLCPDASPSDLSASQEQWPEGDALFHQDPRWLGGDGAYTIDLGGKRTLWLFGDSFIATSPAHVRSESTLVRNSVAVMTGRDPRTAAMEFAWRDGTPPSAFFPDDGDHWFWPSDGVRIPGGALVVFLSEQRPTPGEGLGFANAGWRAVRIADPDGPPTMWTFEPVLPPPARGADAAVACSTVDGDDLVALVVDGNPHRGRLARWALSDVAAGDLSRPRWWSGHDWLGDAELVGPPAVVLEDASTECSLTRYGTEYWVYIESHGFGASTLAMRVATKIQGPWDAAEQAYTPPESRGTDPFVYAGKAHPQLALTDDPYAPGDTLLLTYVANSFTFADLFDPAKMQSLYWPRFVRLFFGMAAC